MSRLKGPLILLLAACMGFALSVAAAQSPTQTTPTAGTPSPSPTTPTVTATVPSPTPGPIYKGRPCTVGTIINDFIVVQEPPPGPVATCMEQVAPAAPERLYRLRTVPPGLEFFLLERDQRGHVVIGYRSLGTTDAAAVQIIVTEGYRDPDPVILRDASAAQAANYLPVPGIAIREPSFPSALWHENGRQYMLVIDTARTTLSIEQVAALLEPFTVPAPPATGTTPPPERGTAWPRTPVAGALLVAAALTMAALGLGPRRR